MIDRLLYMAKIAHVAVLSELLTQGNLPPGSNQIGYGKEKVLMHFGSASALFAVDQLVTGSVRQILRWLSSATGFLGFIPGMGFIL